VTHVKRRFLLFKHSVGISSFLRVEALMYTAFMWNQVAEKIRVDPRVTVIERTNLRYLEGLPEQVDLVTLDLSFISILLV
jgi:predicted rRNA methylase YqxC with S4 and FtsJ domains